MSTLLRIAIQKSGRLQEGSLALLKETGLSFSNGKDQLKTQARNFPVEVLFLRDTRLLGTMLAYLEATGGRYGVQVMCEGGGMANATLIERL
jgi:ATP phosphoribosyltransferase